MKNASLYKLRGMLRISICGENRERFINNVLDQGMDVWNVQSKDDQVIEMNVTLSSFYKMRSLRKKQGCRIKILQRTGFPFVILSLWKRKFFVVGSFLFGVGLMVCSSLVWDVRVKGNVKIDTEHILKIAKQEGIYPFQWIGKLKSQDKLSQQLSLRIPDASWIAVRREGTVIMIEIVESSQPLKKPLLNPRHLVSRSDAIITEIYAEQGKPVAKRNMRVKKGQLLISGQLEGTSNNCNVVAKGKVKGLVWHEYEIQVPLTQKQTVFTGNKQERKYFILGNQAIQVWGYGEKNYNQSKTITTYDWLHWRSLKLPVGWMTENDLESINIEYSRSLADAKMCGLQAARKDIITKRGPQARVTQKKILHEKKESGKVYMKVLFEVEENIEQELPLVHNNQGE